MSASTCGGNCRRDHSMTRRHFLMAGALAVVSLPLAALGGAVGELPGVSVLQARHRPRRIAGLDDLRVNVPLLFDYPRRETPAMLVKLGVPAGGGIGPQRDIIAFSLTCTHMGGDLSAAFSAPHQLLGPCPRHLTRFDLSRHGMVVTGSATESLPQVLLEQDGEDIYAVGLLGLLFGETMPEAI